MRALKGEERAVFVKVVFGALWSGDVDTKDGARLD